MKTVVRFFALLFFVFAVLVFLFGSSRDGSNVGAAIFLGLVAGCFFSVSFIGWSIEQLFNGVRQAAILIKSNNYALDKRIEQEYAKSIKEANEFSYQIVTNSDDVKTLKTE